MSQHPPRRPVPQSELIARLRSHAAEAEGQVPPPPPPRPRAGGWTAERQQIFLHELSVSGSVGRASARCGLSVASAYRLRRHPGAAAFRNAWSSILATWVIGARDHAFERAFNAEEVPIVRKSEIIGSCRKLNDRMLMFVLRHYDRHDAPLKTFEAAFIDNMQCLTDMPELTGPDSEDVIEIASSGSR